jgi:hypothetical protein
MNTIYRTLGDYLQKVNESLFFALVYHIVMMVPLLSIGRLEKISDKEGKLIHSVGCV